MLEHFTVYRALKTQTFTGMPFVSQERSLGPAVEKGSVCLKLTQGEDRRADMGEGEVWAEGGVFVSQGTLCYLLGAQPQSLGAEARV